MKKNLERTIVLPEGFNAEIKGDSLVLKGNAKEATRDFRLGKISLKTEGNNIKISAIGATKRESKIIGTVWAHINNMIKGLNKEFTYTLEICNVHFPMNVKIDGNKAIIKSFLGEKKDRVAKIVDGAKVEIKGNQITIRSQDIEKAGQTATNFEKATRLTGRDRRVFQDGIFLTEKPGRKI